ncbi:MAG: leucine--tRNA ligase [Candidatus Marinamargulisbacteria bacterium]
MKHEYTPLKNEESLLNDWKNSTQSNTTSTKEKKYILEMFPYPSGHLHMGHVRNYSIGDVQARYYRMKGFDVIYPMGFDSFGLPAENAAIKNNVNPLNWTEKNIEHMKSQLVRMGLSYDWSTEVSTSRSSYYHWNQWLFKKLYDAGLIYRKKGFVNWDPVDQTVLANEQVIDGKGWRSGAAIEKREIAQWYIRITNYAEELLTELDNLTEWPERVKNMQRQWIGKNNGTVITFDIVTPDKTDIQPLDVFTTRPDTLMGATYVSIAPEHDQLQALLSQSPNATDCQDYIQTSLKKDVADRSDQNKEKTGVNTGLFARHPITNEHVPLFIADYVLTDYGTGAVMAVPAHDTRDHAFAKKYNLPIIQVIESASGDENVMTEAYTDDGILIQSGEFTGLANNDAKTAITNHLNKINKGRQEPQYKLRDWLISRQRYWGTPIPIVYDENNAPHPVDEADLPVTLPTDVHFSDQGNPIESSPTFKTMTKEDQTLTRETDTMDTFFDSSWYFMRYLDANNTNAPFNKDAINKYLPVDFYIGGIEHACLHLLYARFFTKALRDMGLHDISEPFKKLICQGMVLKDGAKMSKSLGNTVDPASIIEKYGADTARIFILFGAPVEKDLEWSAEGVDGSFRFLKRFHNAVCNFTDLPLKAGEDANLTKALHKVIKKMTSDIEQFQFNTAISQLMELLNTIQKIGTTKEVAITMTKLIAPFAPFLAEDCWAKLTQEGSVHNTEWPIFDDALTIDDEIVMVVQVNGKVRDKLQIARTISEDELKSLALQQDSVKKHVSEKEIVKTIVVKERLINFVVK